MSGQLTLHNTEDKSPSSQVASPASLSAWPGSEEERRTCVSSGLKCSELLRKSDPLTFLVKTCLESSRMYSPAVSLRWKPKRLCLERITTRLREGSSSSRESVRTLSVRDIPSSRLSFQLVPSVRRTGETACGSSPSALMMTPSTDGLGFHVGTERKRRYMRGDHLKLAMQSGLLPTPMATDIAHPKRVEELRATGATSFFSRENGETRPNGLMDFLHFNGLLPTPNAVEGTKGASTYNPKSQMGSGLQAMGCSGLLPTPRVGGQEGYESRSKRKGHEAAMSYLESAAGYLTKDSQPTSGGTSPQLSPLFVEEMMGFPSGWILLPFLTRSGGQKR